MSEPIKQPQNSNNQPPAPQAQPQELESGVRVAQTRNSNSLLRNIVYLLSLIGLVALLFWLVIPTNPPATLAQVTPIATAGGWEIPITQTVVLTATITPKATSTPIVVIGTVIIPPTPLPTPTISYGSLVNYQISEPTYISMTHNVQQFLGTDDQGYLLGYNIPKNDTDIAFLSVFSISGQLVETHTLTLDVSKFKNANCRLQLLGKTDYLLYVEKTTNNLLEFKFNSLSDQNSTLITQLPTCAYDVNDEGMVVYAKDEHIFIKQLIPNDQTIADLVAKDYDINVSSKDFGLALSPQGKYLAVRGEGGSLLVIEVKRRVVTLIHSSEDSNYIAEMIWSPDNSRLAYRVGSIDSASSSVYIVDPNGQNKEQITYFFNQETGDNALLARIVWHPDSQTIAMQSIPYMCITCQEALVLVSKDGKYVKEIFRSTENMWLLGWYLDQETLMYRCVSPHKSYDLCTLKITK